MDLLLFTAYMLLGVAIFKTVSATLMTVFTPHKDIRDWLVILSLYAVSTVCYAATYRRFIDPGFDGAKLYFVSVLVLLIVSIGVTFFVAANIWNNKHDS